LTENGCNVTKWFDEKKGVTEDDEGTQTTRRGKLNKRTSSARKRLLKRQICWREQRVGGERGTEWKYQAKAQVWRGRARC